MELTRLYAGFETCKPYMLMVLCGVCMAGYMTVLQNLLLAGLDALAIVVYQEIVSTLLLSFLAFFIERKKRPQMTLKILGYAVLLGFLQITCCQFFLTICLDYIDATYESIALNLQTAIVFTLAVVFGQENFKFTSVNGQAKLWGVIMSLAGALTMVLWTGPMILESSSSTMLGVFQVSNDVVIGTAMLIFGLFATCFWNILVGYVTQIYPAELSLTATMSFFGTIQIAVVAAFIVPMSSWKLNWEGGFVPISIIFGGITVTGLSYYLQTWCIHTRGPVFSSAFSPLLIVFTFLLDTFLLGDPAHYGSILGAILVVVGLYLLLWAKAKSNQQDNDMDNSLSLPLIQEP